MANYRMVQQEVDDYDKVMGEYTDNFNKVASDYTKTYDNYVAGVNTYNSKPYVTDAWITKGGSGKIIDQGIILSDGSRLTYYDTSLRKGERVNISDGYVSKAYAPSAPANPTYPSKPADLSLTQAEEKTLSSPPQSLSQAAVNSPSAMEKIKQSQNISGSAYAGSLDSSTGILQKVMKGQL